MKSNAISQLTIRRAPTKEKHLGLLSFGHTTIPCSLGKNGIGTNKKEGDQKTPSGSYKLLFGFFRRDQIDQFGFSLPMMEINNEMGWCDDINNPNYNRLVKLPFSSSHEKMYREDHLYDICLVLDQNYNQRTKNRGSAIFFHLTKYTDNKILNPTMGCIAIDKDKMLQVLPKLNHNTKINIHP